MAWIGCNIGLGRAYGGAKTKSALRQERALQDLKAEPDPNSGIRR